MTPALVFEDVQGGYGEHKVLNGVNAQIKPGEFVGLIGSNGTGKSTLLKTVSGLVPLDGGKIYVNGADNSRLKPKERAQQIAVVPQSFSIDYDFTVRDIVMMGRNPYLKFNESESDKDREIVEEAMKMTKTDQFADRLFNTLSGGERQRVIIARAIAQDTGIILLDEPTSALDIHHQIEVMELIERLNEKGITVLAVLHDLNLAARFCDRLVTADGEPKEIMTQENLREIYDMKMMIRNNELFDKPEVIPIRVLESEPAKSPKAIHIVCGSDRAGRIIEDLDDRGYDLSVGVVNENSGDNEVCKNLGIKTVTQKPFMPVTIDLQRENLKLMKGADLVYIADVPFGEMNLLNLYDLENLDKPVYVHEHTLQSDFTGGKLKEALDKIPSVIVVKDDKDFLSRLEPEIEEAEIIEDE